jgi:hypothetical protein
MEVEVTAQVTMQDAINALNQAASTLLVVASEKLAKDPDKTAEIIAVRRQIGNLAEHLKNLS